jgi:hypothetical protein
MKFNLKNFPKCDGCELYDNPDIKCITKGISYGKEGYPIIPDDCPALKVWVDGFEAEIVKVLDLAEGQIKLWGKSLAELKKPKRGTASHEYERIERMILIWKQIKRFCQQILGEEENENYNS